MAIIKLTQQHYKTIDRTKTGWENMELTKENEVLFNTDTLITAKDKENGKGAKISYREGLANSILYTRETLKEIEKLIGL